MFPDDARSVFRADVPVPDPPGIDEYVPRVLVASDVARRPDNHVDHPIVSQRLAEGPNEAGAAPATPLVPGSVYADQHVPLDDRIVSNPRARSPPIHVVLNDRFPFPFTDAPVPDSIRENEDVQTPAGGPLVDRGQLRDRSLLLSPLPNIPGHLSQEPDLFLDSSRPVDRTRTHREVAVVRLDASG